MAGCGGEAFKDVFTQELIVGASNPGATTYDLPLLLNNVLGTKFRIVTGYPGSREITLALERGEVQGACGIGWTGIEAMHPEWFAKDTIRVLVQLATRATTTSTSAACRSRPPPRATTTTAR